jgi:AcrR family transcriptional regulator
MTTSTAAARYTEATRTAIMDAAADLLLERKGDAFSIQEVADRVGLAHRTIYRYFPTRKELIGATAQHAMPELAVGFGERFVDASTVEEWIDAVAAHFAWTEANFDVVRSVVFALLAAEDLPPLGKEVSERDTHRWQVFRRQFAYLDEADARHTFATLRHLMSSVSYVIFRVRFGLPPREATHAIQSAARAIADQAARRDRAARRGSRTPR